MEAKRQERRIIVYLVNRKLTKIKSFASSLINRQLLRKGSPKITIIQ